MKVIFKKVRRTKSLWLALLIMACFVLLTGITFAKYVWEGSAGSFNLNIVVSETRISTYIYDLFYDGSGFYADPNCTLGVRILRDHSIDVTGTGDTEVTSLSQLNGTSSFDSSNQKTQTYSVWMKTGYSLGEDETISGPYIVRRYEGNEGNVLQVDGVTATVSSEVNGSYGTNNAYYLDALYQQKTKKFDFAASDLRTRGSGCSLAVISNNGTLNLASGGNLTNNRILVYQGTGDYSQGSGVYVASGCTLNICGGSVSNNYFQCNQYDSPAKAQGAGVYTNGTVSFTSGRITGNYSASGDGGGIYIAGGTVTIDGGEIRLNRVNTRANFSSAPYMMGGGVCVGGGTLELKSGNISQNGSVRSGGGVAVTGGKVNMSEGFSISGNYANCGAGVFMEDGTFNMSGGTLSGNYQSGTVPTGTTGGAGVYIYRGTFNMSGGQIQNNNANTYYGGGVFLAGNTTAKLNLSGSACITANKAGSERGGGIYSTNNSVVSPTPSQTSAISQYVYGNTQEDIVYRGNSYTYTTSTAAMFSSDEDIFQFNLQNVMVSETKVDETGDYLLEFTPDDGYVLPVSISVVIGKSEYIINTNGENNPEGMTFDPATGNLVISNSMITGEDQIAVTAYCAPEEPTETTESALEESF